LVKRDFKTFIMELKKIFKKRERKFIRLENINTNIDYYKPKANKKKVLVLFMFVFVCLITPFTNGLIFLVSKTITKYKPLWLYN